VPSNCGHAFERDKSPKITDNRRILFIALAF